MKKEFEEVTIWVRRLDKNIDVQITLPLSDPYSELDKAFGDENWKEHDYLIADVDDDNNIFSTFNLYEYQSISEMNKIAEQLTEVEDIDKILAIHEAHARGIQEILDSDLDDYMICEDCNLVDYANTLLEDGYFGEVPTALINYIDIKAIAYDLSHDGTLNETSYGLLIG